MARGLIALLVVVALGPVSWAQSSDSKSPAPETKGPYLGVQPGPVPEVLYEHLASLPRGKGVVVHQILGDSPAVKGGLQRFDILLSYDGKTIDDCTHLARLIAADKPDRKVRLAWLRNGREMTGDVTLGIGPMLTLASEVKEDPALAKGTAKPGTPSKVSVAVTPMDDGKMTVTIEYYQEGTGKLRTATCSGTPADIDGEVRKLPPRVQDLTRAALQRVRALDLPK